jgi:uncharacterized protein YdaU (DUF1376 family)
MAKDPAFLFYSSDFLTGVADLSMDERGVYITLLCLQHQKGRLTPKMIHLCGGNATADVLAKFSKDDEGNFYNERLEVEIQKRKEHTEKQRQRAKDGWIKRKDNQSHGNATALPLENENENINVIIDNNSVFDENLSEKPKKEKSKPHTFEQSPYFDKHKFASAFLEWTKDKLAYYYQSAIDYSESKGVKYLNWAAAVRTWERRDSQEKKGYFLKNNEQNVSKLDMYPTL